MVYHNNNSTLCDRDLLATSGVHRSCPRMQYFTEQKATRYVLCSAFE